MNITFLRNAIIYILNNIEITLAVIVQTSTVSSLISCLHVSSDVEYLSLKNHTNDYYSPVVWRCEPVDVTGSRGSPVGDVTVCG